jgi:hypothetical protein
MENVDLTKYDEINNKMDFASMEYIRERGLLNPRNSLTSYQKKYFEYENSDPFGNIRSAQLGVLLFQMKDIIEKIKAMISDLETQKVLLKNDFNPNQETIEKINSKIDRAKKDLSKYVSKFVEFSETKIGNKEVAMMVAELRANCIEDRIFCRMIGKSLMPSVEFDKTFPNDIVSKYETYQNLLGSINKSEPGLKQYYDYMTFMREKDDKARSNRYIIRLLEKTYTDNPILATPNYQKGVNTKLDMSRYRAYLSLITELPIKDNDIDRVCEFVKNREKAKKDKDKSER